MMTTDTETERLSLLLDWGVIKAGEFNKAREASVARGIEFESILAREYGIPRRLILQALSTFYNCPLVEYDERMPIPPELLSGLDSERLYLNKWFPIIRDGERVVIAASNPKDPALLAEVNKFVKAEIYEFRVAIAEDIRWFILDFLHAKPGYLIGTERTNLALWRNTMAQWRTRLACYRNDLSKARTGLAFLRWGLGFIALADALIRTHRDNTLNYIYWMMAAGFPFIFYGLFSYIKIRKSRMKPPGHQTLVEVTASTLYFLEDYHYIKGTGSGSSSSKTMMGRIGDLLSDHCTILYPSPASKERTHLARERNVLAGQRTVAACYRTIYSRARTGLSFIRTGVAFSSLGLGLMHYFGLSLFTIFDSLLILSGILMVVDGILWYMPVRKEQAEIPRCPVPQPQQAL